LAPKNTQPDWSSLPEELHDLIAPAERFGQGQDYFGLFQFRAWRARRAEIAELRALAKRIGQNNHEARIQSWVVRRTRDGHGIEVEWIEQLIVLMQDHGFDCGDCGPKHEPDWTIQLWEDCEPTVLKLRVDELRRVLPDVAAYEVAIGALARITQEPREDLRRRDLTDIPFWVLYPFRSARTLDWLESWSDHVVLSDPSTDLEQWSWNLGWLAALSSLSWPRVVQWLDKGRPMSLIAIDALRAFGPDCDSPVIEKLKPRLHDAPGPEEAAGTLLGYASRDQDPWVVKTVGEILSGWESLRRTH
jgi:hypothetical protein